MDNINPLFDLATSNDPANYELFHLYYSLEDKLKVVNKFKPYLTDFYMEFESVKIFYAYLGRNFVYKGNFLGYVFKLYAYNFSNVIICNVKFSKNYERLNIKSYEELINCIKEEITEIHQLYHPND